MKPTTQYAYGCVYKVTNLRDGKCYVGQTINKPEYRWSAHLSIPSYGFISLLQRAIRKYGKDAFNFEVLCHAKDRAALNELEDHFINYFNALAPKGYTCLGSRGRDSHVSEETRLKMSLARKGKPPANKGKNASAEACAKMSAARMGVKPWNTGKAWSEENKAKLSAAKKGKAFMSPEQYKAIGDKHRGKKLSDEHRAALSAFRHANPMSKASTQKMIDTKREQARIRRNLKFKEFEQSLKSASEFRKKLRILNRC